MWPWALGAIAGVLLSGVVYFAWTLRSLDPELPPVSPTIAEEIPTASFVYAADGTELARFGEENRVWVDLDEISPHVVDALLATEDRAFYRHGGVHWRRLATAAWRSVRGESQGASTLTMQLARNLYPEVARHAPMDRKLREIRMAGRIEDVFTKRQILELYLNRMSFGHGAFGIEAAARTFFSKTAATLEIHEASTLVGMLKGPTAYDPMRRPDRALERRNFVLDNLVAVGKLAPATAGMLKALPLSLDPAPPVSSTNPAPHFTDYVRSLVEEWGRSEGYDLYRDGLRVFTSIDPFLQAYAQAAVDRQSEMLQEIAGREWAAGGLPFDGFWRSAGPLEDTLLRASRRFRSLRAGGADADEAAMSLRYDPLFMDSLRTAATRLETGLVAIDPHTGYVRAWIGARDFTVDQFDKVAAARRQPGSTFKPFLYAAALESGFSPTTLAEDVVQTYSLPGGGSWSPQNAGGGASGRVMTLREALASSRNTVAARLIRSVGPEQVARTARRMGILSELVPVPSLALGTSEISLLELTSGLGTLVSDGNRVAPIAVTRIEDADGRLLARFDPEPVRALSVDHAYTMVDMLRDVLRPGGTGFSVRGEFGLTGDLAAKTGTTQDHADGWFVLLHPRLVIGAWVGFNQPSVRFRSSYWGQGGHNAARVVSDFARSLLSDPTSGVSNDRFPVPHGYLAPTGGRLRGNLVSEEGVRRMQARESDETLPGLAPGSRGQTVW